MFIIYIFWFNFAEHLNLGHSVQLNVYYIHLKLEK